MATPLIPASSKLLLLKDKKCYLCNNPFFRDYDEEIWSRAYSWKLLQERFQREGYHLSISEITNHSRHLRLAESSPKKPKDALALDKIKKEWGKLDSVEVVDARINIMRREINEIEESDQMNTTLYFSYVKLLKELIELKEKVSGKIVDNKTNVNITFADLVKKLKEK